jgi:hypothetical protein
MRLTAVLSLLPLFAGIVTASPYRADLVNYNINTNQNATSPEEYSTNQRSSYTPSPVNWRALPVYTILLDKFADGDPSNNDYFGTPYESDWRETQLRFGGDLAGLLSKLDYLQGMGIKVIYISGTIFVNMIWEADSEYISPSPYRLLTTMPLQVTHRSTCPLLTLIGATLTIGSMQSTQSMLAECISCWISLLVPWVILLVSKGTSSLFGIYSALTSWPSDI